MSCYNQASAYSGCTEEDTESAIACACFSPKFQQSIQPCVASTCDEAASLRTWYENQLSMLLRFCFPCLFYQPAINVHELNIVFSLELLQQATQLCADVGGTPVGNAIAISISQLGLTQQLCIARSLQSISLLPSSPLRRVQL